MTHTEDLVYMRRCIDLATLGSGYVSPNPMVGALLAYKGKIIGEGYHQKFGGPHAEVNAVESVPAQFRSIIPESTLYVSLEPCCFFGKTPACTDLILRNKIKKVVIGTLDPSSKVNGKGIKILEEHGVQVKCGVLEEEAKWILRYFRVTQAKQRPYIKLKFAQSQNGFIGLEEKRTPISNEFSRRMVHKWRHEIDGILIGTKTALVDNPRLNNRYYFGKSPTRIVLDAHLKIPPSRHLFDGSVNTIIVYDSDKIQSTPMANSSTEYLGLSFGEDFENTLLKILLTKYKIGILMVEGGAKTINRFSEKNLWEEALVITADNPLLPPGIKSPAITGKRIENRRMGSDQIKLILNEA